MAKRPISDELLNLAIESKLDAGVSAEKIRVLMEAFAGDETEANPVEVMVGFLSAEDIPPSRRAAFLNAVLAFSPEPKSAVAMARRHEPRPGVFGISLLSKAKAALRFGAAPAV